MRSVIVLPTYNERENIADLVRDIFLLAVPDLHVMIVDDNSPDGTGQLADELARQYPAVSVLHRRCKEGLGRAYIEGFKAALADPRTQYIFEMDADFSHQPKYLPIFLEKIKRNDLVLGSRYITGGGVENWGFGRRFISWFANMTIRVLLGVPLHDLTGGFKCFSRRALTTLDLEGVESSGYNFQIEMTYKAYKKGLRIAEVPIIFVERRAGRSKFNPGIMLESFWRVLRLRFSK